MPNIRVRQALEKIDRELTKVAQHVAVYSGIDQRDAAAVDNVVTGIAETAAQLAALAREKQGDRSSGRLVRDVRKSLGFTVP